MNHNLDKFYELKEKCFNADCDELHWEFSAETLYKLREQHFAWDIVTKKFLGLPYNTVHVLRPFGDISLKSDKVPMEVPMEFHITLVGKSKTGRIRYFDHPENNPEWMK
jgi:hypothetical protein